MPRIFDNIDRSLLPALRETLALAIIRLIQRAGRVDRIGQKSNTILCYSFWPADGVERIIRLRSRVRQRLRENAAQDCWVIERSRGSHRQFRHPSKPGAVTVSAHPSDTVHPKTLKSVLRQAGLEGDS